MSTELDNIIKVTITEDSATTATTAFNIPMIAAEFSEIGSTAVTARAFSYANLTEMTDAGWLTTDPVYIAAIPIFSQKNTVDELIIGRRDSADTDWATALNAIQDANNDWYGFSIIPVSSISTEALQAAAWSETVMKRYFAQISDVASYSSGSTTDLAYLLKTGNYSRTAGIYHLLANANEHLENSWFGEAFPFDPGSDQGTWAFKKFVGVTPDTLTSGQKTVLRAKRTNFYTTVGGNAITQDGVAYDGEYIDVHIGIDWTKARIQEAVFTDLVNNRRVSFDDAGIQLVGSTIKSILLTAERMGIYVKGSSSVTLPKFSDFTATQKKSRKLTGIKFSAEPLGAVQYAGVEGHVSYSV